MKSEANERGLGVALSGEYRQRHLFFQSGHGGGSVVHSLITQTQGPGGSNTRFSSRTVLRCGQAFLLALLCLAALFLAK